jgi:hypothetical protein
MKERKRLEDVLSYITAIRKGHLGTHFTAQQIIEGVRGQLLAFDSSAYPLDRYTCNELIVKEVVQMSIALWPRFPFPEVIMEFLELATPYYSDAHLKASNEKITKPYLVLREMYHAIVSREQKAVESLELPQNSISLLEAVLPLESLWWICQYHEHNAYYRDIVHWLITMLHYGKKKESWATLQFLESYEACWKHLPDIAAKLNRLEDQLLVLLKKQSHQPLWDVNFTPPPQRDPLERVSWQGQAKDQWLRFLAFMFNDPTAGPARSVHLAMILIVAGTIGFLGFHTTDVLITSHKVENVIKYDYMQKSKRTTPDFVKFKSKYEGNQLKTGSHPYPRCFGEGQFDFESGNRLSIKNNMPYDVVACVYAYDAMGIVRHTYIRSGDKLEMSHLPAGAYTVRYYLGKDWNPLKPNFCGLHGAFDTNPHYLKISKKEGMLLFEKGTKEYVVLDKKADKNTRRNARISASSYFSNRNRGLPLR